MGLVGSMLTTMFSSSTKLTWHVDEEVVGAGAAQ